MLRIGFYFRGIWLGSGSSASSRRSRITTLAIKWRLWAPETTFPWASQCPSPSVIAQRRVLKTLSTSKSFTKTTLKRGKGWSKHAPSSDSLKRRQSSQRPSSSPTLARLGSKTPKSHHATSFLSAARHRETLASLRLRFSSRLAGLRLSASP